MKTLKINILFFLLAVFVSNSFASDKVPAAREENVSFKNGNAVYSGTLTLPDGEGPFPLVILVSGMGPQTRDWKFGSNYCMAKIIADSLAMQHIAVYRYDDRGTGESSGVAETLTSFDSLADDVYAAVCLFRTRGNFGKIGLCGHSLGGILSIIAASKHSDIDFVITLSGSYQSGGAIMMEQAHTLKRWKTSADMKDEETVANGERFVRNWVSYSKGGAGLDTMKLILSELVQYQIKKMSPEKMAENLKTFRDTNDLYEKSYQEVIAYYTSPHQKSFAIYDPVVDFPKIGCPVLAMFGEKDAHVVVSSNKPALIAALRNSGTMDFTLRIIPGADHGYSNKELYKLGRMSPGVLDFLSEWILARCHEMPSL